MAIDLISKHGPAIRQLIPLNTLPGVHFETLCNEMIIETAKQGDVLFKNGDSIQDYFYLLSGSIVLQSEGLNVESISAASPSARFALAHQNPRKIDAIAQNDIHYLRINADYINNLTPIYSEEESSFMVIDEPEESPDDWMTTLLKSPIFQRLPAANLQKILIELKDVQFSKGAVITKQGDPGDYYYLIKSGQCILTRKPSPNAREIKLTQLRVNDTFGEDALLSGNPINETITALTDMNLLRINKEMFISLIKEPALDYISYQEMQNTAANDKVLVLDVRPSDEFKKSHLEHSINAPFFSLRMQLKTFARKKKIIVVCKDGKTSQAAAFLLIRNKFSAIILSGGIIAAPDQKIIHPATFKIDDGIEKVSNFSEISSQDDIEQTIPEPIQQQDANPQLEILLQENDSLRKQCNQLKLQCSSLIQEKEQGEKKYRILFKQTNKLKEVLDKIKKGAM